MSIAYAVFSKPWKGPLKEMAEHLSKMGFEGVELPVRPGFQVEPDNVAAGLPEAAKILADHGMKIGSVAQEGTGEKLPRIAPSTKVRQFTRRCLSITFPPIVHEWAQGML